MSHDVRRILLQPHWLAAALSAAVFFLFALNRGGVEPAIWAAGALLIVHAVAGRFELRSLQRRDWLFLAAIGGLLVIGWALAAESPDPGRSARLVKLAILVMAVRYLAHRPPGSAASVRTWVTVLVVAVVLWQFAARHLQGSPYGTYANPHYLAYFAALLLPVLFLAASWQRPPWRWLLYGIVLLDLDLVFNDLTKPTLPLLALATGLGAFVWSLVGRRTRWIVAGMVIAFVLTATLLVDEARFTRLGLATPSGDERVQIWSDSLRMLRDNDARGWLAGNGIGSFRHEFRRYFPPKFSDLPLPHNHLLELLYENGAVVTTLVVGFLGHLAWRSLRLTGSLADPGLRALARCNLSALAIWFVFSFLAFGAYSRYTLYPFGIMVGLFFHLTQQPERPEIEPGPTAATATRC